MQRLIFDIETIGEDFNELDEVTQDNLTSWIKKDSKNEEDFNIALKDLKKGMGLSPLTGEIVAIGLLEAEEDRGAVYYQDLDKNPPAGGETDEEGIKYKAMDEKEMLKKFWEIAKKTDQLISFNGRGFDVPFLMVRSAVHGIRPSVNLLPYRYAKHYEVNHIDLLDHLTFLGLMRGRKNLHLWCNAFNIKSPKSKGVSGGDVQELFKNKKYLVIAKYNVDDLFATRELYKKWKKYLAF